MSATPRRDHQSERTSMTTPTLAREGDSFGSRPGAEMARRPASTPLSKRTTRDGSTGSIGLGLGMGVGVGGGQASGQKDEANVQVVLRIRPSHQPESTVPPRFARTILHPSAPHPTEEININLDPPKPSASTIIPTSASSSLMAQGNKAKQTSFRYDRVLGEDSRQEEVYEAAGRGAVEKFLKGLNVTVLAYGQTSSGKSYSMGTTGIDDDYRSFHSGSSNASSVAEGQDRTGLIPRAVGEIFKRAEEKKRESGLGAGWECRLSFLELYNEELIDLLSNVPHAQAPPIIIREDKGRILWSGLREVPVNNTQEVMKLLKDGSHRRRTGETGMNKESSRSHAIFSLSLTQRRRNGASGGAGSPGALGKNRPMSTPAGGMSFSGSSLRSPTPTGLRTPNRSSMIASRGLATPSGRASPALSPFQEEEASWVEISSKFHFVDLAGSERLKRTGAGGDRMKEGISINSGLTALGNVISALADPVKSKSSHVPYRDSKLTRLMQDSLGGNAFTVMIACVSPIEFNLNETLNTLKYAARARNIKNRAEINEVEVGWEDVEHLQSTVVKLRAEVERLKGLTTGEIRSGSEVSIPEDVQSDLRDARTRLEELEAEHDILKGETQSKSIQLARLATELEASRRSGSFNPDDVVAFSKLVEPIVEEYERLIQALEAKLQTTLTALELSETRAEEAEEMAEQRHNRIMTQDGYATNLVTRVNRMKDKEKSLEEYIADLEDRLKSCDDLDAVHIKTIADLRAELAEEKRQSKNNLEYIVEMETTTTNSIDQAKSMSVKAERLETELRRKEQSHIDLQERISSIDTTHETQLLLEELDNKASKLEDLEQRLDRVVSECEIIAAERDGLRKTVDEQADQLSSLQSTSHESVSDLTIDSKALIAAPELFAAQDNNDGDDDSSAKVPGSPTTPTAMLHSQDATAETLDATPEILNLQMKHAATLAELAAVTHRYKEALEKINLLSNQVEVVDDAEPSKRTPTNSQISPPELARSPSATSISSAVSASSETSNQSDIRRQSTGSRLTVGPARSDFRSRRGDRTRGGRPLSLSQELSLSRSSLSSLTTTNSLLSPNSTFRQSLPVINPQRTVVSFEAEIKQLQEILQRRDDEIRTLENAMRLISGASPRFTHAGQFSDMEEPYNHHSVAMSREASHISTMPSGDSLPQTPGELQISSPIMTSNLEDHFGSPIAEEPGPYFSHDKGDQMDRMGSLMRSMARKETEHKHEVERLGGLLQAAHHEIEALRQPSKLPILTGNSRGAIDTGRLLEVIEEVDPPAPSPPGLTTVSVGVQTITSITKPTTAHAATQVSDPSDTEVSTRSRELEQKNIAIQASIRELVVEYGLTLPQKSINDAIAGLRSIGSALSSADVKEHSLRTELDQLRNQASENQKIKSTLETVLVEKTAQEALVNDLKKKLQDATSTTQHQIQNSESENVITGTTTSRMSFARSATSTSRLPPKLPPPSMPPPPLPSTPMLPEGLPPANQALPFLAKLIKPEFEISQARPTSPNDATDPPPVDQVTDSNEKALQSQIVQHKAAMEEATKELTTLQTMLRKKDVELSTVTANLHTAERTLRKIRLQSQEDIREREYAQLEVQRLQSELDTVRSEMTSVRNSIIVEKQSLEERLSEERKAKERTRAQLEERLEAAQKQQSKFRCF